MRVSAVYRLLHRDNGTVSLPVLALALRTDHGAILGWDHIGRNLEHLARLPRICAASPDGR